MRNIFKILIGLVLITINSCDDHCTESYLAIVNNSGKDIEINSYTESGIDGKMIFSKKIIIVNNNKTENKFKYCGNAHQKARFSALIEGDSIVIDFGDRIQSYGYLTIPINRNPFQLDFDNKSNDFVYTLTPEDYTNATPK